jgi:hypothetical protein
MSRSLSSTFLAAVFAQQTDEVFHTLITISGTGITTKRYVNNYEDVTSGGNTYTASAFNTHWPHDLKDQIPDVALSIDNVDRAIIADIRSVAGVPQADMRMVLQSDPNTVEIGPLEFKIRRADYSTFQIQGTLQFEDILNETFPSESYTTLTFPGLFP